MLDPKIKGLSTAKNYATICFHLPGGQIGSHVMWVDATDDHLLINTEVHRVKYTSMAADPNVTLTVMDAANPYAYGEVRGRVSGEIRGSEARAHIDALSQRYVGTDYQRDIQSERVIVQIEPVRQRTYGL